MAIGSNCGVDSALQEAKILSDIVFGWMANTLEFEKRKCRDLSEEDCAAVYWSISTLSGLIDEADRLFREREDKRRVRT